MLVLSKRFDVFHEQYRKTAKSFMKFKWGRYNTVMSLLLKKEFMYHGVQDFAYLAEYFNSMMAPEAMQEGVFSVLKELLQRMGARMGIEDINLKFKIKRRFRNEFSAKSTAFLKRVCEGGWTLTALRFVQDPRRRSALQWIVFCLIQSASLTSSIHRMAMKMNLIRMMLFGLAA